jgi:hypothetical protein
MTSPDSLLRPGSEVRLRGGLVECDCMVDDRVKMLLQDAPLDMGHVHDLKDSQSRCPMRAHQTMD